MLCANSSSNDLLITVGIAVCLNAFTFSDFMRCCIRYTIAETKDRGVNTFVWSKLKRETGREPGRERQGENEADARGENH